MRSNREKSKIDIKLFEEKKLERAPKIISHFGGTNNI